MKLNVGCGYKKMQGYLNVDINPQTKPDFVMPAYDLDFPDEHFNEITAIQVIEHLGFFKTKYFLSECSRVLKKEKFLIIETPHIEKSFELFLNSQKPEERERILGWIYGSETEFMNHVYCFPVELMETLLKEFGFEIYKKEFYDYEYLRPAVRYVCINQNPDIQKAVLRKNMIKYGALKSFDEIYFSEFEKIISDLNLGDFNRSDIYKYVFLSPIVAVSLDLLKEKENADKFEVLIENNFTGWIFEVMTKYYKDFRDEKKAFEEVKKIFFDNPDSFIYNFIDNKRKSSIKIPILNEYTFLYEFNKRGIR